MTSGVFVHCIAVAILLRSHANKACLNVRVRVRVRVSERERERERERVRVRESESQSPSEGCLHAALRREKDQEPDFKTR